MAASVLYMSMSLDGDIADPNDRLGGNDGTRLHDWALNPDKETFRTDGAAGVTDRINSLPKYVASSTLTEPLSWNATLIKGDVPQAIARLKEQPGQSIVMYGCGKLAKTLFEHNPVDEFRVRVYPVVRGKVTRLFEDGVNADPELVETGVFAGGFVVLTCRPKRVT